MIHKRKLRSENRGIGMTSQGTRDRLVQTLRKEGIKDERVLKAITQVPRHEFIDEALSSRAYENTALPIGQSQTISQPWIVARMTEAMAVEWARFNINVNCIAPGAFSSEMMDGMLERIGDITVGFPRKRICDPAQMDSTLLFLVSPSSECVTGTVIKVDDGQGPR